MTTLTLSETGTACVWCRTPDALDGDACPNDPTVCATCCPCHGFGLVGVEYVFPPGVDVLTYGGMAVPLHALADHIGPVPLTPHRVALALRAAFGVTASDQTALAVFEILRARVE